MSIWTRISDSSTSWSASDKQTTSWTSDSKQITSWSAQDKKTTTYRTLNTFKEIVFLSSYEDSLGFTEIILDNASNYSLNVKSVNFADMAWTVV